MVGEDIVGEVPKTSLPVPVIPVVVGLLRNCQVVTPEFKVP
jgi:hypothetical protein